MKYTIIGDMNTGGYYKIQDMEDNTKQGIDYIILECKGEDAKAVFYARFRLDLDMVSCTCCGEDFDTVWVDDEDELKQELKYMKKYSERELKIITITKQEIKDLEQSNPNMYKE